MVHDGVEHDEYDEHDGRNHPEDETGKIAAEPDARERSDDGVEAQGDTNREDVEQLPYRMRHLHLVDALSLGRNHKEADDDLQLDMQIEFAYALEQLQALPGFPAAASSTQDDNEAEGE